MTVRSEPRFVPILGWVATITSITMYLSYIDQIRLNLSGHPGSVVQPLATMVNCTLWTIYGVTRAPRDWPIAIASFPGVILGTLALVTAL